MATVDSLYMNVYNNYMTSYNTKSLTRFDTHKKDELKDVYDAIVKWNKESPLYKVSFSQRTQEYAVELKEGARGLKNVINDLTNGNTEQIFNKRAVFSENPELVSAKYVGTDSVKDLQMDDFSIEVHSLAKPQVNQGKFLPRDQRLLDTGTYIFNVDVNDLEYEFQFGVGDSDTNVDVQNKLKRLINKSNIGLKAEVLEENGAAALQIASLETGYQKDGGLIFQVSDIPKGSYGVVAKFGLDQVETYPEDSSFSIDGEKKSTHSNTFLAGKVLEITLNDVSDMENPTTIGFKTDTEAITEHIETFVSEYNSFLDTVRGYSDEQPKSETLIKEYTSIARRYMNELESIGLEIKDDGTIGVDKALLVDATKDEENYKETLQGINGFKNAVLRKVNQSLLNPMEYVDKVMLNYKKPTGNYAAPYITSIYSGMMFNSYC